MHGRNRTLEHRWPRWSVDWRVPVSWSQRSDPWCSMMSGTGATAERWHTKNPTLRTPLDFPSRTTPPKQFTTQTWDRGSYQHNRTKHSKINHIWTAKASKTSLWFITNHLMTETKTLIIKRLFIWGRVWTTVGSRCSNLVRPAGFW